MSEYRVNFTQVPGKCQDTERHSGVLIHIRPPVQLNPDAVERYLSYGDFEPINRNDSQEGLDIKDVVVLGSTLEQTTIYASIKRQFEGRLAQRAAEYTVGLLDFMGATAIIDQSPTPDA